MRSNLGRLSSGKIFKTARSVKSVDKGFVWIKPVRYSQPGVSAGVVVTKKLGNAVERNRIRRRIKNAMRIAFKEANVTCSNLALVIIAKKTENAPFVQMVNAFQSFFLEYTSEDR